MENKTFITADAERNIPVTEPERQYYFIEKAKEKLTKLKEEKRKAARILTENGNHLTDKKVKRELERKREKQEKSLTDARLA